MLVTSRVATLLLPIYQGKLEYLTIVEFLQRFAIHMTDNRNTIYQSLNNRANPLLWHDTMYSDEVTVFNLYI